jgi:hypothetical protein
MPPRDHPTPAFARFERVVVRQPRNEQTYWAPDARRYAGAEGTVIWQEPPPAGRWRSLRRSYAVYLPELRRYRTFVEDDLASRGEHDPPAAHRGAAYEFGSDTVVGDDETTIEGCVRTPGAFWRVMIFSKWARAASPSWRVSV